MNQRERAEVKKLRERKSRSPLPSRADALRYFSKDEVLSTLLRRQKKQNPQTHLHRRVHTHRKSASAPTNQTKLPNSNQRAPPSLLPHSPPPPPPKTQKNSPIKPPAKARDGDTIRCKSRKRRRIRRMRRISAGTC